MEEKELKIDPIFQQLIENALNNKNQTFQFICSLRDRSIAKTCINATKKVVKLFKKLEESSAFVYAEMIKQGKQSVEALLAYMQFKHCVKFYEKEIETLKDMLKEYRAYVWGGNLFKTLLGIPRAEDEMVDYRTLPWTLF